MCCYTGALKGMFISKLCLAECLPLCIKHLDGNELATNVYEITIQAFNDYLAYSFEYQTNIL